MGDTLFLRTSSHNDIQAKPTKNRKQNYLLSNTAIYDGHGIPSIFLRLTL